LFSLTSSHLPLYHTHTFHHSLTNSPSTPTVTSAQTPPIPRLAAHFTHTSMACSSTIPKKVRAHTHTDTDTYTRTRIPRYTCTHAQTRTHRRMHTYIHTIPIQFTCAQNTNTQCICASLLE
jgi:hypothetical protein